MTAATAHNPKVRAAMGDWANPGELSRSGKFDLIEGGKQPRLFRQARKARYLAPVIVAILGAFISVCAFVAVSNWEHRVSELNLLELAKDDQQKLNFDLRSASDVLYTLRAFYQAADHAITRPEFQAFAKDLRSRLAGLRNTGWARRVTREERGSFEDSMRRQGFLDFQIWERDSAGARVRAADRAVYFPVLYPDPEQHTSQLLGFDLASEPVRANAIKRALISERSTSTPPLNLITTNGPDGFVTFLPVYPRSRSPSTEPLAPDGLMYGVFGTAPMIENMLESQTKSSGLDIYFFDPKGSPGARLLYWHSSPSRSQPSPAPSERSLLNGAHWTGMVEVADQEWGAIFSPSSPEVVSADTWEPAAVLGFTLAVTSSIVSYLLLSLRRTLHLEFLTASLRRASDELQAESDRATHLARHDPLTKLANRVTFNQHLLEAFLAAKRGGKPFAVICMDIDHFKDVNDTLGHPCGDRLLQITADRLKPIVRASDIVARLGGDEFAILVRAASSPAEIAALAKRINVAVAETLNIDSNEVCVSASLGISIFEASSASPDELMMQADLALYEAKKARGGYCFHSASLDTEIRERVAIARELQAAIGNGELQLYYQPQIEVRTGRIVGIEALIRWNHPVRGLTPPGAFIPIAERSGMIHPLGYWVLEQSCLQIQRWRAIGISPPPLSINVSAAQLRGPVSLDQELRQALTRHSMDPSWIEIELTETALFESTDGNDDVIARIQELGVRVAIDDFGTGYSSMEYLQRYKVNKLKIAQHFVSRISSDPSAKAIVRTMLVLARELGVEAIAEGVETAEELAFLLSAGCLRVQGYYYSRPVPETEASDLLRAGFMLRDGAPRTNEEHSLEVGRA